MSYNAPAGPAGARALAERERPRTRHIDIYHAGRDQPAAATAATEC
ncbi:hypothetical protein [Saccharopolyspora sp. 5N708]